MNKRLEKLYKELNELEATRKEAMENINAYTDEELDAMLEAINAKEAEIDAELENPTEDAQEELETVKVTMDNLEEVTALIFGAEEFKAMKERAAKRTKAALEAFKNEIEEIMHEIDENNDIMSIEEVKPMTHTVLLDGKEFRNKPNGLAVGSIQKRLPNSKTEVTIKELGEAVIKGRTFKPAYLTGTTQETFVSASLIAVDIDNKGEELEQYGYVSIDDFLEQAKSSNIKPALVYTTFSHTEAVHKYRAIFQLEEPVTDLNQLKALGQAIKAEYPYADAKVSVSHLIFGGRKIVFMDEDATVSTKIEYNEKVETKETSKTNIKGIITNEISIDKSILEERLKALNLDIDVEYGQTAYDYVNKNVSIAYLLQVEEEKLFKCVLPNHNDKNASAYVTRYNDEWMYKCSGCQTFIGTVGFVAELLDMSKAKALIFIANAAGIRLGSEYQRNMRALIAEIMSVTDEVITEESILYKHMKRGNLHGVYNLLQQFALAHITPEPLADEDQITFFISQSQLADKMKQFEMKGSTMVGYKLNALKEIGLIRPLRDEEIRPEALAKANEIRNKMTVMKNTKYMNRVEYYELVDLSRETVEYAESIITALKKSGVKRNKINATRRAAALGEDFVSNMNVQMNVISKVNDSKLQSKIDKLTTAASTLIKEQGYFTEEQLRKQYDPKRKQKKDAVQKLIDDSIPFIIKELEIKKDRVKKATRTLYSIPSKIKTNTTIYC